MASLLGKPFIFIKSHTCIKKEKVVNINNLYIVQIMATLSGFKQKSYT